MNDPKEPTLQELQQIDRLMSSANLESRTKKDENQTEFASTFEFAAAMVEIASLQVEPMPVGLIQNLRIQGRQIMKQKKGG